MLQQTDHVQELIDILEGQGLGTTSRTELDNTFIEYGGVTPAMVTEAYSFALVELVDKGLVPPGAVLAVTNRAGTLTRAFSKGKDYVKDHL